MASLGAEGEVGMSDDSQEDHPPLLRSLEHATEHRFSDWPNELVPTVAAGVYTVWESDRFLYVGMAGRNLTSATVEGLRASGDNGVGWQIDSAVTPVGAVQAISSVSTSAIDSCCQSLLPTRSRRSLRRTYRWIG